MPTVSQVYSFLRPSQRVSAETTGVLGWLFCSSALHPGETEQEGCWQHLKSLSVEMIELFRVPVSLQSGSNFPVIGKVTVTALSFVCSDT